MELSHLFLFALTFAVAVALPGLIRLLPLAKR